MIQIVVAYNEDFVIGNNCGQVPWHIPEDFKHFKDTTMGCPCIMGRKTWDSIPEKYRPLPGRRNIILSRTPKETLQKIAAECGEKANEVVVCSDIYEAIDFARMDVPAAPVCIIGGEQIYRLALERNLVDKVIASEINIKMEINASAHFPDLKAMGWKGRKVREYKQFDVIEYVKS